MAREGALQSKALILIQEKLIRFYACSVKSAGFFVVLVKNFNKSPIFKRVFYLKVELNLK